MINPTCEEKLFQIPPEERVLLLPHCLRPSETCPGKHSRQGLLCPDDCSEPCSIRILREAAIDLHYKGVCIAPGGGLALRFVGETQPRGVVAIACDKELELGIHGLEHAAQDGDAEMPEIVVVPLLKDGCVDTQVDVERALKTIRTVEEPLTYLCLPYPPLPYRDRQPIPQDQAFGRTGQC